MTTLTEHEQEQDAITRAWEEEIITRAAPRWAWDIIDETLSLDIESPVFDPCVCREINRALVAMSDACEKGD